MSVRLCVSSIYRLFLLSLTYLLVTNSPHVFRHYLSSLYDTHNTGNLSLSLTHTSHEHKYRQVYKLLRERERENVGKRAESLLRSIGEKIENDELLQV